MAIEIERKFLVVNDGWRNSVVRVQHIRQGYIAHDGNRSVRIRRADEEAYITVKGNRSGISRQEFEYKIPVSDADEMLDKLCFHNVIEKIRHTVIYRDLTWQIDVFSGPEMGIVIAEVELTSVEQNIIAPDWAGEEVTRSEQHRNSSFIARRGQKN